MENHVITDIHIREYLLGFLDIDSELVELIDEHILTDPEFSISVDVIEDEIIEEYIEGLLSLDDLQAVERHFLRPPERQLKLKNARLFARHLADGFISKGAAEAPGTVLLFLVKQQIVTFTPRFRTYGGIAAVVFLAVSFLYLSNQRRHLNISVKEQSQQSEKERPHSPSPSQQLQAALQPSDLSVVTINLLESGLRRGISDLPETQIGPATTTLHFEVALISSAGGKYQVQLKQAGKVIWSHDDMNAVTVSGGGILKFNMPAKPLSDGIYELSVIPRGTRKISYWFLVKKSE